jgi:hypothetical protein
MFKPYKDHKGLSYFKSGQLLAYGNPESLGFTEDYYVVEEEEEAHPRVFTYSAGKDIEFEAKKIHRYCRISRFRGVLYHLMGMGRFSTRKSKERLSEISHELPVNISYTPPCLIWDVLWGVLKRNKISKCYSAIPTILHELKLGTVEKKDSTQRIFRTVMDDFIAMHHIFESIKSKMDRQYFPSLRSIALLLLHRHGFKSPISIPIARTPSKVERIEFDYAVFWDELREKEMMETDEFFGF